MNELELTENKHSSSSSLKEAFYVLVPKFSYVILWLLQKSLVANCTCATIEYRTQSE